MRIPLPPKSASFEYYNSYSILIPLVGKGASDRAEAPFLQFKGKASQSGSDCSCLETFKKTGNSILREKDNTLRGENQNE